MGAIKKNSKLRILLADDHAILREGLAALINGQPDMEVVAHAENGREAIRHTLGSAPDVVVLDLSMPDIGGAQVTTQILIRCPRTRILILTRHNNSSDLERLLRAGATGYVVKRSAAADLIKAIRCVAQGQTYVDPDLVVDYIGRGVPGCAVSRRGRVDSQLSSREKQVLRAIARGRGNKVIAAELELSVKTIESYKATAMNKLGLHSRVDIVRYAVAHEWLSDDRAPHHTQ